MKKAVGQGAFQISYLNPGLQTLLLRCLLDTRWRCQVYFFTSLDFDFFLLSLQSCNSIYSCPFAFSVVVCVTKNLMLGLNKGVKKMWGSSFSKIDP